MSELVSIVITSFNKAPYLEQSIESVLAQTYPQVECIIVDDGSTDGTGAIAQKWAAKDPRVSYFFKENGGISSARNFSFSLVKGKWVQFLDADDWIHEDKIRFQVECLEKTGCDRIACYSDYERVYVDETETIVKRQKHEIDSLTSQQLIERLLICPDFLAKSSFPLLQQTMLFSRSLLDDRNFDETLQACEDRELVLNWLYRGIPFIHTPIIGAFYRKHASNLTDRGDVMRESYVRYFELVQQRYPDLLPLCQTSIHFLLEKAFETKDDKIFHRALPLVTQFPVPLLENKIQAQHSFWLPIIYQIRKRLPNFLFYERYRGPRSKKLLATFQRMQKFFGLAQ